MNDALYGLELLAFIGGIYLLPTILAGVRSNPQTLAIFVLNLLLGWTVLGWVGALVWACVSSKSPKAGEGVR